MNALDGAIFDSRTHKKRILRELKYVIKNTSRNWYNHTNITFPVTQKDYRKIEIMNNINISVFGYQKQEPYPVYILKENINDTLNLLLITKGKEQHYVLIKDFNKIMYKQTKHARRNSTENCILTLSGPGGGAESAPPPRFFLQNAKRY